MLDCNVMLVQCNALLPSALVTDEVYQWSFNPSGLSVFGMGLPTLLERAGKMVAQR